MGNLEERLEALEKENRELKKQLQALDSTTDWCYWQDEYGNLRWVSEGCLPVTGYTRAEFFTDADLMTKIIHPDDLLLFADYIHRVSSATNGPHCIDLRIITKENKQRWITHRCELIYDRQTGRYIGRRVSNRDATRRILQDEMLKISEARYRNAVDNVHDLIGTITLDGRLLFANRALLAILKINSLDKALGAVMEKHYIHPEDKGTYRQAIQRLVDGQRQQEKFILRCISLDGRSRLVEWLNTRIGDQIHGVGRLKD